MEEVVFELSIVCYFSGLVEEFASAAHQTCPPLAFIAAALLVAVTAPAFTFSVQLEALVAGSVLVLLDHAHGLLLEGGSHAFLFAEGYLFG